MHIFLRKGNVKNFLLIKKSNYENTYTYLNRKEENENGKEKENEKKKIYSQHFYFSHSKLLNIQLFKS